MENINFAKIEKKWQDRWEKGKVFEVKEGKKKKYFLRRYKRGIREEEIIFEHSIIRHLKEKSFTLSAGLLLKKDGSSSVKEVESINDNLEEVYFAVFEFLQREDKYTWDNPVCDDQEL